MENVTRDVEFTYEELIEQNKALSEELSQCQHDKDFVWNLWKNLQVEKPDMTNIISQVVDREQQKSDAKDLKVLNILQQKDNQIKILEDISADLQTQLKQSSERLSDLLLQKSDWDERRKERQEEKRKLEFQLEEKQEILKTRESHASIVENETRERLVQLQKKNTDLLEENTKLVESVNSLTVNLNNKEKEIKELKESLMLKDEEVVKRIQDLDEECQQKQVLFNEKEDVDKKIGELKEKLLSVNSKFEDARENFDIRGEQLQRNVQVIQEQDERLEQQDVEIQNMRKQLDEHKTCKQHIADQSQLIQSLEALQDETQKVLSKQQATHQDEVGTCQKTITKVSKKNKKLQHVVEKLLAENNNIKENEKMTRIELQKRNEEISTLAEASKRFADTTLCSRCGELEEELQKCHSNYNKLLRNYERNHLATTQNSFDKGFADLNSSLSEIEASNTHDFYKAKIQTETIEKLQQLVKNMEAELRSTRRAHKQRHQRYKVLQENYNLALQQLATYEEISILSPKQEERAAPRASAKSLQHENSKSVWNELEHYRKEFEKLNDERPGIEEELDEMRVKTSRDETKIAHLNLKLLELENAFRLKEEEQDKNIKHLQSSEIYSLQKQLEIWKDKVYTSEREIIALTEANSKFIDRERFLQNEMQRIQSEAETLRKVTPLHEQATQTDVTETDSRKLFDKMNEVIDAVQSDRLTVNQLDSSAQTTTSKSYATLATQTSPNKNRTKARHAECSTQTDLTSDSSPEGKKEEVEEDRVTKKKKKLRSETQRLQLLKSNLSQENRSLKKRIFSLETQVSQLRESRSSLEKHVETLQLENENFKSELVANLQKLQATREILQERSRELEESSHELQQLRSFHRKDNNEVNTLSAELKTMENKLKHAAKECSKMSFETKTLKGENEMLSVKLKEYQERITSIEKTLSQKKTYTNELKEKYNELKDNTEKDVESQESLSRKLKSALERDIKNKNYIENLKSKVDTLTTDKVILQQSLTAVKSELENKSRLLHDSQVLCRQAETAIGEMENTAYEQLHQQQKGFDEKHGVIKTRYHKCVAKVNEHKIVVKNFMETMLSQIHDHRSQLLENHKQDVKRKEKRKEEEFFKNKAHDVACSILNMSTADLHEFMQEEHEIQPSIPQYEDNDIREKLELILKKESNFGKILTKFLLDIVSYDITLREKLILDAT